MYIPLHGHSTFSFLEAISSPAKIVKRAKEIGMYAIAITDFGGMYGLPAFTQAAKDGDIKAILGVELGFVLDLNANIIGKQIGNIVLLAKTQEGYQNLMKLTSFANQEGLGIKPKIDFNKLKEFKEGIIVISGGTESWIGKMINAGEKEERILEIHQMIRETCGEDYYLEIIAQDEHEKKALRDVNQLCLSFSEKTGVKCIINNEFFYPEVQDYHTREIALAIRDNLKMYDPTRRQPKGKFHLMTEQEIIDICISNGYTAEQISERIQNNEQIAENINAKIIFGSGFFPKYDTPANIQKIYEENKDTLIEF
ncbi:hypothetical protein AGMMS50249_6650 [candidate division SR1 bacterium]|nr:hypothetical protein AGMMS50249_6650 [candidate division SR1 bacterium]